MDTRYLGEILDTFLDSRVGWSVISGSRWLVEYERMYVFRACINLPCPTLPTIIQQERVSQCHNIHIYHVVCFDNVPDISFYSPKCLRKSTTNSSMRKHFWEPWLPTKAEYNTSLDIVKLHPFVRQQRARLAHFILTIEPTTLYDNREPRHCGTGIVHRPSPIAHHSTSVNHHSSPNHAPPTNMLLSGIWINFTMYPTAPMIRNPTPTAREMLANSRRSAVGC